MKSRMETYLNAAISGNTENLPKPISRIDFLLCELIKTLGESGASIEEVEKIVTDKVAEIVANAPEDFNTLKELSDWIYTHEESAAAMNTAIQTNANSIESLMTDVNKKANSDNVYDKVTADSRFLGIDATADKAVADENGSNISETFSAVKNDIAVNKTTLGYQCKNLFKNTVVSQTAYGVTFTVNNDKSITTNGTATQTIYLNMGSFYFEADKQYILNGCPSGGSETKYFLAYDGMPGHQYDTGSGTTFSVSESVTKPILLVIKSGQTVSNLRFKPMLRYADITDSTYEPYKESVDERLIEDKSNITINKSTLGYQRKNLLKNNAVTQTVNGVTFTVNDDKSVTLNGTSTAQADFYLRGAWGSTSEILQKNKYIASIGVSQSSTFNGVVMHCINNTTTIGSPSCNYPSLAVNSAITAVYINVSKGYTFSNYKLYPMIRDADILDDTYEPYQPSVREQIVGAYFPMTAQKGIVDNTDLNTITELGNYICWSGSSASTMINCPTKAGGFRLIVTNRFHDCNYKSNICYQWIIPNNQDSVLYYRRSFDMSTNSFGSWYSFGGTLIS